jgi:two-component system sensor histidine kinase KdpD
MSFFKKYRTMLKRLVQIIIFTGSVIITTKLTLTFGAITGTSTAAFCFLILVLLSAFFGNLLVAIITSLVATLCFDYFYLLPLGTFNITAFSDWISLAAFLLTSVIISRLTASAFENKYKANMLGKVLQQLKKFGEWLFSLQQDKITITEIAEKALQLFNLEYCSIHVYSKGEWSHFTGSAVSNISQEIESKLKDHPTDLLELADENIMGVQYMQINEGKMPQVLLVVKSETLPSGAMGPMAYIIGMRVIEFLKDKHSINLNTAK